MDGSLLSMIVSLVFTFAESEHRSRRTACRALYSCTDSSCVEPADEYKLSERMKSNPWLAEPGVVPPVNVVSTVNFRYVALGSSHVLRWLHGMSKLMVDPGE